MATDGDVSLAQGDGVAVIRAVNGGLMLGFALNNLSGAQNISLKTGDIYYMFTHGTNDFLKLVNESGYVMATISLNLLSGSTDLNQFNRGDGRGWNTFPWFPTIQ